MAMGDKFYLESLNLLLADFSLISDLDRIPFEGLQQIVGMMLKAQKKTADVGDMMAAANITKG